MKQNRNGCLVAFSYLFMAVLIPYIIISVLSNSSQYFEFLVLLFVVPASFVGFFLFMILDWGLKMLWNEKSMVFILPIIFALSVPFIWEHFALEYQHDISIPIVASVAMLLWSIISVALQLGLGLADEKA